MLKLIKFYFKELVPWEYEFGPINFNTGLNLLIGKSGVGKTKFLNILSNISNKLGRGLLPGVMIPNNTFIVDFEFINNDKTNIKFYIKGTIGEPTDSEKILKQPIKNIKIEEKLLIDNKLVIHRKNSDINLIVENKKILVTLNSSILAHEIPTKYKKTIEKIKLFFSGLMRLNASFGIGNQNRLVMIVEPNPIVVSPTGDFLESSLYLIKEKYKDNYKDYLKTLKSFFPTIEDLIFKKNANKQDVVMFIKEKTFPNEYYYAEASSGMHRIMGILNIIFSPIFKTIICIDEIDNGIDFEILEKLFYLINEYSDKFQVIATSHHPFWQDRTQLENWIFIKNKKAKRKFYRINFDKISPLYKTNKYSNSKLLFEKNIPLLEMK